MEINGERVIGASQQTVWDAINDPEILKLCIPGGESVERTGDNEMKAVVLAKIGPVRARFSGKMTMTDVVAPNACTLVFEGTGGPAGFAKGQATVTLTAQGPSQTLLVFSAAATVGGKLGQIGARLIESAARTISDEFFTNMMEQLAPGTDAAPHTAEATDAATPTGLGAPSSSSKPSGSSGATAPTPATPYTPTNDAAPHTATATGSTASGRKPVPAIVPVSRPGVVMVDTRWFWAIGCLIVGYIAGHYF